MEIDAWFLWVVVWIAVGGGVGVLIGKSKGRPDAGFIFGALLGVIGWLLVAAGPDYRPKCPACLGAVPVGASRCMHCGAEVQTTQQ